MIEGLSYGSVCSGIEAATVAWQPLGWKAAFFSEIEPLPCSLLNHHYPAVPNFGDMTKFKEWPDAAIDVLVGGTPCQSFSVAGLRKGLDDPRGNLMLTYLAIADRYRPRWLVWENVPGVLSSNGGRDFGTFLGGLGQLGYGFAYRILDAQYAGVPQRRRRVFVVGCFGDWRRAAAVLFERHSLQGHNPPSRKTGQGTTYSTSPSLTASGRGTERTGESRGQDCVIPVHTTGAGYWQEGVGTLRGRKQDSHENILCLSTGQAGAEIGIGTTLNCNHEAPIVCHGTQDPCISNNVFFTLGRNSGQENVVTHSLRGEGFDASEDGTGRRVPLVAAFSADQSETAGSIAYQVEQSPTLRGGASGTNMTPTIHAGMQVRRLTPLECERLQGFPDYYSAVPHNGKPAADGPRYKALGNSMAVPCMRWIGERIQAVESLAI